MITIYVARNLPDIPWERYEGEQFRIKFLLPAIENSAPTEKILIDFDRGYGYGTGFLKGVFDAESSVHPNRFVIALSNKNTDLLEFCKKLLKEFDIKTGSICRSNRDVFEVCIFGGDNLEKYRERIGFSHPDRIKKLNRILKRYIGS